MAWLRAAMCAALFVSVAARTVTAQDIALTSRDGTVRISGNILGFDGEFYRVETQFGELTVDATGVTCEGPACPSLTDYVAEITFSGASAMAESLLPALIKGFALRNGYRVDRQALDDSQFALSLFRPGAASPLARFTFRTSTTEEGLADLVSAEADIAMAQREIRLPERAFGIRSGLGDLTGPARARVLALDALVPVVAPENPISRISLPDLSAVVSGEIANWTALGGPDAPITLHLPDAGSGLAQAVEDSLLKPTGRGLRTGIIRHRRAARLAQAVSADPFAIGISGFAGTSPARALTISGSCGFSLAATRRTIKTEDYPLNSPIFLYLSARRLPKPAREFLAYVSGPEAQIVIRRAGFVDQLPELVPLSAQGTRFANAIAAAGPETPLEELQRLVATLDPMARLTISFRFETGSARPDAQSRDNILRLARDLESGSYDARKLVFVGFSDGKGGAEGNTAIALRRAESVRDAVLASAETLARDRVEIAVDAFGEALPMACDDSDWGRQVNRRVEVWVQ